MSQVKTTADDRLAVVRVYIEHRRRQLDRADAVLPELLTIIPDATVDQVERLVDVICGTPRDVLATMGKGSAE